MITVRTAARVFSLTVLLQASACGVKPVSESADRQPQAAGSHYLAWVQKAQQQLQQPFGDSKTCVDVLSELNNDLRTAPAGFFLSPHLGKQDLYAVFGSGKKLRQQIRMQLGSNKSAPCRESAMRFIFLQRTAEEVLLGSAKDPNVFASFPRKEDLKSGDVLLMRGKTFFSASIAQLANSGASFSHSAIVHVANNGQVTMMESLAEVGVLSTPYETYLAHHMEGPIPRIVHLRARDLNVAAKAADLLKKQIDQTVVQKKPILYDYVANVDDRSQMFCTEVVRWSYLDASRGRVDLPSSRSSMSLMHDKTPLLKDLGINRRETAMPADFEVDPFFEVIGEYRHAASLPAVHRMDAVLSSMYEWMIKDQYIIQKDIFRSGIAGAALLLRDIGILSTLVPSNVRKVFVDRLLAINNISGAMIRELQRTDARSLPEMKTELLKMRKADCINYKNNRFNQGRDNDDQTRVKFHLEFRKANNTCP